MLVWSLYSLCIAALDVESWELDELPDHMQNDVILLWRSEHIKQFELNEYLNNLFVTIKRNLDPRLKKFAFLSSFQERFAFDDIEDLFSNSTRNFGRPITCLVARNGDFVFNSYLQITLPS